MLLDNKTVNKIWRLINLKTKQKSYCKISVDDVNDEFKYLSSIFKDGCKSYSSVNHMIHCKHDCYSYDMSEFFLSNTNDFTRRSDSNIYAHKDDRVIFDDQKCVYMKLGFEYNGFFKDYKCTFTLVDDVSKLAILDVHNESECQQYLITGNTVKKIVDIIHDRMNNIYNECERERTLYNKK